MFKLFLTIFSLGAPDLSHVRAQSTLDNRETVFCEFILLRNSFFVKQNYISLKEAFLSDAMNPNVPFFAYIYRLNTKIRLTVLCLIGFKRLILVGCP